MKDSVVSLDFDKTIRRWDWDVENGEYVNTNGGNGDMTCDSAQVGPDNLFVLEEDGDGRVTLRGNNGRYVSSNNGVEAMTCDRFDVDAWERFS